MGISISIEQVSGATVSDGSLRVLVACEESQAVTKEFRKLGHEAFSCDLLPESGGHPQWHFQAGNAPLAKSFL